MKNLSHSVMEVLGEYKDLQKSSSNYMAVYKTATESYKALLQGIRVEVVSDGSKYYMFDKGCFFYCGVIDNNDLNQTVIDDIEQFGFVMLALKHLDNKKIVRSLMSVYETKFYEQLIYVLGYCTVRLDDGTSILLREYLEFFLEGPQQLTS